MAIITNIEDSNIGVPFPTAYVKIGNFTGEKDSIYYQVSTYANADARWNNGATINSAQYDIPTASVTGSLMAALYADLKSRPDYAGAVDDL